MCRSGVLFLVFPFQPIFRQLLMMTNPLEKHLFQWANATQGSMPWEPQNIFWSGGWSKCSHAPRTPLACFPLAALPLFSSDQGSSLFPSTTLTPSSYSTTQPHPLTFPHHLYPKPVIFSTSPTTSSSFSRQNLGSERKGLHNTLPTELSSTGCCFSVRPLT